MKRLAVAAVVLTVLALASVAFAENGPKFGATSGGTGVEWTRPVR